jgi:hypothetical protein
MASADNLISHGILLHGLIETAQRMVIQEPSDIYGVKADTTSQEMAKPFPTCGNLYSKGCELLVEKAKVERIYLHRIYFHLRNTPIGNKRV